MSVAGYLGLLKKSKKKGRRKNMPDPNQQTPTNPFAIHAQKPQEGSSSGDDLNELVKMFQGTGGMIQ